MLNPPRAIAPTFTEWFKGRFWTEWVITRKNKPTERLSKEIAYDNHLEPAFGRLTLDKIGVAEIARFRAKLVEKGLRSKRINNILCVLSKPLKYAADCDVRQGAEDRPLQDRAAGDRCMGVRVRAPARCIKDRGR